MSVEHSETPSQKREPVDKWLPREGDGPVTTEVVLILRRVTGTAQFVTRLIEGDLLDVVAHVRELEAQADQLARGLMDEMQERDLDVEVLA